MTCTSTLQQGRDIIATHVIWWLLLSSWRRRFSEVRWSAPEGDCFCEVWQTNASKWTTWSFVNRKFVHSMTVNNRQLWANSSSLCGDWRHEQTSDNVKVGMQFLFYVQGQSLILYAMRQRANSVLKQVKSRNSTQVFFMIENLITESPSEIAL